MKDALAKRYAAGRNSYYKFFWKGDDSGIGGVVTLVARKWIDNVIAVIRCSTRLISYLCYDCFVEIKSIINSVCVYAPQPGLSAKEKDCFYEQLLFYYSLVMKSELICLLL